MMEDYITHGVMLPKTSVVKISWTFGEERIAYLSACVRIKTINPSVSKMAVQE